MTIPDTSVGLLDRVQEGDADAWGVFAARCYDVVRQWCRWHRLDEPDADDVVQSAMLVMIQKIAKFRHSGRGSFRGWLRAIAWRCHCKSIAKVETKHVEELRRRYSGVVEEIDELEEQYNSLYQSSLLQHAMLLVKQRVRQSTWTAFYRTAWCGESCNVVAADLSLPDYVVYSAKSRTQKLIEAEVRKLASRGVSPAFVSEFEALLREPTADVTHRS